MKEDQLLRDKSRGLEWKLKETRTLKVEHLAEQTSVHAHNLLCV